MFFSANNIKVYIALGQTDMRKSIDGLSILVSDKLDLDPFSGHMFVFCNKKKNIIKVLFWDRNGFCLYHKRLEKDRFKWPASKEEIMTVSTQELAWMMDGLSMHQISAHKPLKYSEIF